jgi:hypothetical protein
MLNVVADRCGSETGPGAQVNTQDRPSREDSGQNPPEDPITLRHRPELVPAYSHNLRIGISRLRNRSARGIAMAPRLRFIRPRRMNPRLPNGEPAFPRAIRARCGATTFPGEPAC